MAKWRAKAPWAADAGPMYRKRLRRYEIVAVHHRRELGVFGLPLYGGHMANLGRCSLVVALSALLCCKDDPKPQGTPPPPPAPSTATADLCAQGGGSLGDPSLAPFFPKTIGAYCIDPAFDPKSYGEHGKLSMKALCETALDGGCEEYMKAGVTRAVIFHYVQAKGQSSVEVLVSQFPNHSAFGLFTTRLVGDLDPADPMMMRPIDGVVMGAMGTGKAYLWRGTYFVELTYTNDQETPQQLTKSSATTLTALSIEISSKLPDKPDIPASAKALPETERLPLGLLYYTKDTLGVAGLGAGAAGFYRTATSRWRAIAIVKEDAEQAKDAMKTLSKKPGALPVSNLGDEAVQVVLAQRPESPKVEYVFARKGATVFGVSDEELDPTHKSSKDDKVSKVRALLR